MSSFDLRSEAPLEGGDKVSAGGSRCGDARLVGKVLKVRPRLAWTFPGYDLQILTLRRMLGQGSKARGRGFQKIAK
jgi:hypothetical protein